MKRRAGELDQEGELIKIGAEFLQQIKEYHYRKSKLFNGSWQRQGPINAKREA